MILLDTGEPAIWKPHQNSSRHLFHEILKIILSFILISFPDSVIIRNGKGQEQNPIKFSFLIFIQHFFIPRLNKTLQSSAILMKDFRRLFCVLLFWPVLLNDRKKRSLFQRVLEQIITGTGFQSLPNQSEFLMAADHYDCGSLFLSAKPSYYLYSADSRHSEIQKQQIRAFGLVFLQCLCTAACLPDNAAVMLFPFDN